MDALFAMVFFVRLESFHAVDLTIEGSWNYTDLII